MTSSKEKYHTLPKASAEAFIATAAQQRCRQDPSQKLLSAASSNKLRDSSPRWKEHYDACKEKWGAIASGKPPIGTLWDEIQEQKAKGQYPWTHLSHDQDAEVWIDPAALPTDMSRTTLRSKDASIPREWFHLPKGAEPPTVDDLLRDSSPETPTGSSNGIRRAKSPPICGRSRSKSRETRPQIKFIQKKFVDDGGYEPVGGGAIKPLHQIMLPVNASVKNTNGHGLDKAAEQKKSFHDIPPRKAVTALPTPPSVDRTNKPAALQNMPPSPDDQSATAGGYEPVGKPPTSKKKDYEDVIFKQDKSAAEPKPTKDVYAKVDLETKAKEKEAKALKEKEEKQKKQKEEKERKEREKEKKLKEKQEKEQREREEKERKQREKDGKEKEKREKAMRAEMEKKEKERKQHEKMEMEAKKLKEKQEKEQREKEEKERKQHEKEEKEKAKAEMDKQERDRKQNEKMELEAKKIEGTTGQREKR